MNGVFFPLENEELVREENMMVLLLGEHGVIGRHLKAAKQFLLHQVGTAYLHLGE